MKYKILVIDDELEITKFIARKLVRSGYIVATAINGKEGLQIAKAQDFNLILTDVIMPELNGLEFYRELKKIDRLAHIPIIVFTAWISAIKSFEKMDIDDYLIKPFAGQALIDKVHQVLNRPSTKKEASTILISQQDVSVIEEVLQQLGEDGWRVKLQVVTAKNEKDLNEKALSLKPDILFINVLLKNITAVEIIRHIKYNDTYKDSLIFAYTNLPKSVLDNPEIYKKINSAKDACIRAGATQYINSLSKLSFVLILYEYL